MTVTSVDNLNKPVDSSATQPVAAGTSATPDSPGTFMSNTRWRVTRETPVIVEDLVWAPSDSGCTVNRRYWF